MKKYLIRIKTRQILMAVMLFTVLLPINSLNSQAVTYERYVGDYVLLVSPDAPAGAAIFQTAWASHHKSVSVSQDGPYSAIATINEYFTDLAEIQCDYYYYWYDSYGHQYTRNSRTYYYIKCKAVTINLSDENLIMDVGDNEKLSYSYSPSNVSPKPNIYFTSSNYYVADVSSSGYISAISSGTAIITAHNNMGPDATCQVSVRQVNPTDVSIPSTLTAYVGESTTITPTLYPSNAQSTLTWYSTNTSKATVSNGSVTGKDEGKTQVYCVTANNIKSNYCDVTVKYRTPTGISFGSSSDVYLPIGQGKQLTYSVTPSNARTTVTWSTGNTDVINLSPSGYVTALKSGTAYVTVKTDNGYSAKCKITVPPDPDKITLYPKASMVYGEKRKLNYSVYPTDAYLSLTWKSSDPDVVTVSSSSELYAKHEGKSVITVTTQNGKTAECEVTVLNPDYRLYVWLKNGEKLAYLLASHPKITHSDGMLHLSGTDFVTEIPDSSIRKITLSAEGKNNIPTAIKMTESLNLSYHEKYKLVYELLPADYDINTTLSWKSSDPHVAIVDDSGNVYAVGGGETDITLTAGNGCKAICHVSVPIPDFNLIVCLKDGTKDYYALAERPVARFENGVFHVVTNDKEMFYPASDVRKFTMENGSGQILPGDANDDGVVNVNDIATIATFILNGHVEPWNEQNADANGDGTINVNDIAQTATIILNQAKSEIIQHK